MTDHCWGCNKLIDNKNSVSIVGQSERICFDCDDSVKRTSGYHMATAMRKYIRETNEPQETPDA